jgi:two-component system LytT family response regulator
MKRRALLVDDEPLARRRLRRLLAAHAEIEIVGEAENGEEALREITRLEPDLVFLDVQMPGLSGFDVLARLETRPDVVFVTAFDEFAVQAFEEEAVDYLLKPVEPPRLARSLSRLSGRGRVAPPDDRLDRLLAAVERAQSAARRIAVRRGAKVLLVDPAAVLFARAEDKYAVLYTVDAEHVLDRTLDDLEQTLDPEVFLRIHRSVLVNTRYVRDLTAVDGGRFLVTVEDRRGTKLYASRAGAKLLRERLGL